MPIFRFNYNNPGPGVDPNEPRKKGIKRFFEVLGRDFGDFLKLNLFYFLFMLLPMFLFLLVYLGLLPPIFFVASLVAAVPMGGVYSTMVYCITKKLRDDPEYIWYDMKRKFAAFFKQGILPGILYTAFLFGQMLLLNRFILFGTEEMNLVLFVLEVVSLVLISMVLPYVFVQIAYVDLGLVQIIKNSLIFAIANLPRSFMGALLGNLLWFLFLLFFPISLVAFPVVVLVAFSISWLGCLMWVWPPVDKQFNIESTLRERYESEFEDVKEESTDE